MATSIGEAIGSGLERGLRIGTGLRDRERNQRRQDEQDALEREDRQVRQLDRQRTLARQTEEDARRRRTERASALTTQLGSIRSRMGTVKDPNSPEARDLTTKAERVAAELDRDLVDAGGYDFEGEQREATADLQALTSGRGDKLPPARRVRAITAATRRDVTDFRRGPDGSPSRIGAAIEDFRAGLGGGDSERMLRGANVLLAPELQRGIGEESPHGGAIVGKEVVAFDPAPGSSPEDPQMIPRLRVWVAGKPKNDEEARLIARWRAANPGAPEGATGFYFAPVTEDRSSRPDAPVRIIGMRRGMQYLDGLRQMEEWVNDPAVAADIDVGRGQWNPQRFLAARGPAAAGKTQYTPLPADGALLATTTDPSGAVTERVIASPTTRRNPETEQARLALLTAQTAATAALGGLRERTDPNRGSGNTTKRDEARERLGLLTQERISVQGRVANLVREMEFASGPRRKEIPGELAAARRAEDDLTTRIRALQKEAGVADAPAPAAPAAAPAPPGNRPPLSNFMR